MNSPRIYSQDELDKIAQAQKGATVQTGEALRFDVNKLIKEGRIEEDAVPLEGYKVKMHTLTVDDYDYITNQSGRDVFDANGKLKTDYGTLAMILTMAITEINGKAFASPEEKKVLRGIIGALQPSTLDKIVTAWVGMQEKQSAIVGDENVKKNS
jgi:hypothetical protein